MTRGRAAAAKLDPGQWSRDNIKSVTALATAHLAGAVFTFVYLSFIAPNSTSSSPNAGAQVALFVAFALVAFPVTGVACQVVAARALAWVRDGRVPTDLERTRTLTLGRRLAAITYLPWIAAAAFFGLVNSFVFGYSGHDVAKVAISTLDGGLVSCTIGFLLLERVLRPTIAVALDGAPQANRTVAGIRLRLFATWALGSGVPLAGLMLLPLVNDGTPTKADIRAGGVRAVVRRSGHGSLDDGVRRQVGGGTDHGRS